MVCGAVLAAALVLGVAVAGARGRDPELEAREAEGRGYMARLQRDLVARKTRSALVEWAYATNITNETEAAAVRMRVEIGKESKAAWQATRQYPWRSYQDGELRRMFRLLADLGPAALPDDKHRDLVQAIANMESTYSTAKICDYVNRTKCDLSLEPEITDIMSLSGNPEELKYVWSEWHRAAGAPSKQNFMRYVELSNEGSKLSGHNNTAEYWLYQYETDGFERDLAALWRGVVPLYRQLHAYVRRRLRERYGEAVVSQRGPIPAHLLGNMWAQTWSNVESFTRPYPDKPDLNVTEAMIAKNYTVLKMFQMADEFFKSLNLTEMPESFWKNSIIEKPNDGREMVCHASAWDFGDGEDFRIKMCSKVQAETFEVVHHEMGHIEYYLQYKHQPSVFREGANPGFHEAVGDTIALSVNTPKHLRKIDLLQGTAEDEQTEINQLYRMGIDKIAFLPFGYLLDLYRYSIFRGETSPADYNCAYWTLREQLQGVEPPVERTERDFDAAAKYHVSADVEYARYYVSFIVQFQFHRALCELAGEYSPGDDSRKLMDCDIYRSVAAGNALGKMLRMGSSRPWPDALEALTGTRALSADGLLEYFAPLHAWLRQENERTGEYVGWEPSKVRYCTDEQKEEMDMKMKAKTKESKQS